MKWYKYPCKISKETNTAFVGIGIISFILQLLDKSKFDWRIFVIDIIAIISAYVIMVLLIKKLVWDKLK